MRVGNIVQFRFQFNNDVITTHFFLFWCPFHHCLCIYCHTPHLSPPARHLPVCARRYCTDMARTKQTFRKSTGGPAPPPSQDTYLELLRQAITDLQVLAADPTMTVGSITYLQKVTPLLRNRIKERRVYGSHPLETQTLMALKDAWSVVVAHTGTQSPFEADIYGESTVATTVDTTVATTVTYPIPAAATPSSAPSYRPRPRHSVSASTSIAVVFTAIDDVVQSANVEADDAQQAMDQAMPQSDMPSSDDLNHWQTCKDVFLEKRRHADDLIRQQAILRLPPPVPRIRKRKPAAVEPPTETTRSDKYSRTHTHRTGS